MLRTRLLLTAAAVLLPSAASAQAFDFESVTHGAYGSVVQSSGGQTLTVTSSGGWVFADLSQVAALGATSLIGSATNPLEVGGFAPLRFSFSTSVSAITFAFGDGGGDSDTPARISAFDALDNFLGTFDTPYPANDVSGGSNSLAFGGSGASYFILSSPGGVGNDDSIYWEVTSSTQVQAVVTPEPASIVLMATGLGLVGGIVRRRRNKA